MGVETFEGEPIDIELPSSVSGQHLVNFSLRVGVSKRDRGRLANIRAEITLPVHLRYPDPGCERRGEDCEEYARVEVSKRPRVVPFFFVCVNTLPFHFCVQFVFLSCSHSPSVPCSTVECNKTMVRELNRPLSAEPLHVVVLFSMCAHSLPPPRAPRVLSWSRCHRR